MEFCFSAIRLFNHETLLRPEQHIHSEKKTSSSRRFHPWFVLNFELRSSFRFVMVVNPMRNMKSFGWRPGNSRYLLFEVWRLGMQKKLQWLTHPCVRLCEEEFVWKSFGGIYTVDEFLIGNVYVVWFSNRESGAYVIRAYEAVTSSLGMFCLLGSLLRLIKTRLVSQIFGKRWWFHHDCVPCRNMKRWNCGII